MSKVSPNEDGFGLSVRIDGIRETSKVLNGLDPKVKLAMFSTIRGAVRDVQRAAQARAPFVTGTLIRGITVKKGRYRGEGLGYKVVSDTRQGAILELAGSASSGFTEQGRSLIRNLRASSYPPPGRFVWAAWDDVGDGVTERITAAVERAEAAVQAELSRVRGGAA